MAFSPQTLRRIRPSVSGNMPMQRCNENCPASETTNRTGSNCCSLVPTPPQASASATHNSLGPDLFCDRGVVRRTTQRFWMDLRNLCAGCAAKLKAEIHESKDGSEKIPKSGTLLSNEVQLLGIIKELTDKAIGRYSPSREHLNPGGLPCLSNQIGNRCWFHASLPCSR
jgi:hypothetical protein